MENWAALGSVWVLVIVLLVRYFYMRGRDSKTLERISELEETVKLIIPASVAFRNELIKVLMHDYAPKTDVLLVKMISKEKLTIAETGELLIMLKKRAENDDPRTTDEDRDAARIMPGVMRFVDRAEAAVTKSK